MKDAWDGYYAAKRTPVNEDGREEAAREEESATGYAVNETQWTLIVCDSKGLRYAFPGGGWATDDNGIVQILVGGEVVAEFREWMSVCRVHTDQDIEAHLRAAEWQIKQEQVPNEPQKQWTPRRANLQQG